LLRVYPAARVFARIAELLKFLDDDLSVLLVLLQRIFQDVEKLPGQTGIVAVVLQLGDDCHLPGDARSAFGDVPIGLRQTLLHAVKVQSGKSNRRPINIPAVAPLFPRFAQPFDATAWPNPGDRL
jgi:hypothetical protein